MSFLILWSSDALAQSCSCSWVDDANGRIPGIAKIDGQVFFLFSEERTRETAKKLKDNELLTKEVELLNRSVLLHKSLAKTNQEICDSSERLLEMERESFKRLADEMDKIGPTPWYQQGSFIFTAGAVAGVIASGTLIWIATR